MWHGKGSTARQPEAAASIAKPPVHRITVAQFAVLLPLGLGTWVFTNGVNALSLICGALVAIGPQAWFAAVAFRKRGARQAEEAARMGYVGGMRKFVLSAAGFAVVFALLRPIDAMAVFAGYICMLIVQIIGSWRLLR